MFVALALQLQQPPLLWQPTRSCREMETRECHRALKARRIVLSSTAVVHGLTAVVHRQSGQVIWPDFLTAGERKRKQTSRSKRMRTSVRVELGCGSHVLHNGRTWRKASKQSTLFTYSSGPSRAGSTGSITKKALCFLKPECSSLSVSHPPAPVRYLSGLSAFAPSAQLSHTPSAFSNSQPHPPSSKNGSGRELVCGVFEEFDDRGNIQNHILKPSPVLDKLVFARR